MRRGLHMADPDRLTGGAAHVLFPGNQGAGTAKASLRSHSSFERTGLYITLATGTPATTSTTSVLFRRIAPADIKVNAKASAPAQFVETVVVNAKEVGHLMHHGCQYLGHDLLSR